MPQSDNQIGFEQPGIAGVLKQYWLRVPLNQREYSWTEREVTSLFHDINNAISEDEPEYFLGSIVTIPKDSSVLEVVDGQQRLSTTVILLAAIRDYLRRQGHEELIVADIEGSFLTSIDRAARERSSKLRLNVIDSTYFEQRIIQADESAEATAPSHTLIDDAAKKAAKFVRRVASTHDAKTHGDVLNRWVTYLEQRAIVVLLKVPSASGAYKMFETLNDRGLKTSQSDLVKNYLFGEARNRLDEAQAKWGAMRAILEAFEEDDQTVVFLRQMLISMEGYLRESQVYETVQATAKGSSRSLKFLDQLEKGATDFVAIQNSDHEKWNAYPPGVRRSISTLRVLRMQPARPLLLSIARKFQPAEADGAMRLMISLAVRLLIFGGARSGGTEQKLALVAQQISNDKISTAAEVRAHLDNVIPTDRAFQEAFAAHSVSNAKLARYYLRSLEMTAKGEKEPWYLPNDDPRVINLEHILPRNPEENWPQFSPEEADAFYKRIGNLALLQAVNNADLRSAGFRQKIDVYKESPYILTSQIAELDNWTPDTISERQRVLAGLAVKTWPVS